MALIVEAGQQGADSESLASVAFADLHHSNRGNAAWALLATAEKEAALRSATDYLEQTYRLRWAGYRRTDTQALSWPRYYVPRPDTASNARYGYGVGYYAFDSVPTEVQKACAELALRSLSGALLDDLDRKVISEAVGPISTTYDQDSPQYRRYPAIDRLLLPLLAGQGNPVFVRS